MTLRFGWSRLASLLLAAAIGWSCQPLKLAATGDYKELREREDGKHERKVERPRLLVLAVDGVGRRLLYEELRAGKLPGFSSLLYGDGPKLDNAYMSDRPLSILPSTTMAAWASVFTGVTPAQHGVVGNEFFVRETRQFAAPVPVTIEDAEVTFRNFTEGYANALNLVPTVYERMRKLDPNVRIWVAMHPLHAGADRLLLTNRGAYFEAFKAFIQEKVEEIDSDRIARALYAALDEEILENVIDQLEEGPVPDVLTVYLVGIDAYAHTATEGPDAARRAYLREVLDPQIKQLSLALSRLGERNRFVIVTSDHGHTPVLSDDKHSLGIGGETEPTTVLSRVGFRVRPPELEVGADADFSAVVAYQGAFAYVYLADRSTCLKAGQTCDFRKPPRLEEDVLVAAQAFCDASASGKWVPELKGALDAVFIRPKPDAGFVVLNSDGRRIPLAAFAESRPEYLDLEVRLNQLTMGPAGARAGDILLLANNANREDINERYYFSGRHYHSWHGSPGRRDSEVALILGHPSLPHEQLQLFVQKALGSMPYQYKVSDLMLNLRYGSEAAAQLAQSRLAPWR